MKELDILKRIFVSVTTFQSDWQKQVNDIKKLKLKEISLFLTCSGIRERKRIFEKLRQSSIESIVHVHLRYDMKEEELDFLVNNYKTKAFSIHYPYLDYFIKSKYKKRIFVENNYHYCQIRNINKLSKVGGLCVDLSHLKEFEIRKSRHYNTVTKAARKYKVGCNHLSAVLPSGRSWHEAKNFSSLAYVKDIPKKYFSNYICLELTNSITQQIKFKKQLAKLLLKTWNIKS